MLHSTRIIGPFSLSRFYKVDDRVSIYLSIYVCVLIRGEWYREEDTDGRMMLSRFSLFNIECVGVIFE